MFGRTAGLKARELTLSSGGDVTSTSFIGLWLLDKVVLLKLAVVPKEDVFPAPNRLIFCPKNT